MRRKITVEEAEAKNTPELPGLKVPFGYLHRQWLELKAQIQPGDQLYEFRSSPATWEHLCGREGIELERNGEVIAQITTCMN